MTCAPVFRVADVAEAEALVVSWTRDNFAALKEAAEETTNHGELLDVTPYVVGNSVYLRFRYDTKDAMGMNMATIATEAVCGVVEAETAACLPPPRATSVPTRSPPPSTPSRGAAGVTADDVRIPREVVEERRTPRPKRSRNSTHARTWSVPRRPRARVQRPRRQRRRRDVPRHRAGRGAGRRGRERHHDRRGAGRRGQHARTWSAATGASVSIASPTSPTSSPRCSSPAARRRSSRARTPSRPPRSGGTSTSRYPSAAPSAAAKPRRSPRASISGRQRRRPRRPNADAPPNARRRRFLAGELSLSALASRHLSSAHAELGR